MSERLQEYLDVRLKGLEDERECCSAVLEQMLAELDQYPVVMEDLSRDLSVAAEGSDLIQAFSAANSLMSQLEVSMTLLRAAIDQTCELVDLDLEDNIENVSVKAEKNLRHEEPNKQRFLLEKFQMKAKCITQDISISKAVYRKIYQRLEKLHCETRNISEKVIQSKQAAFKFNMFVEIFKSLNSTELEVFRISVAIEILAARQRSIENLEKPTVGMNSRTKTQPEKLVVKQSNVTSSQPIFSSTITDERRLPSSLGKPLCSPPLGDELQSTKQKTVNASSKIPGSVSRQLELDHRVVTYLEAVRRKCVAGNLQNPPDFTEDKPAQFELECGIPGMFWLAFPSPGREALQRLIQVCRAILVINYGLCVYRGWWGRSISGR